MAFHPYPQLIPSVFNLSGFAPPQSLTSASHWPWVDHPASGPEHATHTLVRIRFRYGSPHSWLTTQHATDSQAHSSKGTPPPHPQEGGYDGLSAHGFRYSFTPLPGYFSPFPHGTHPLSVIRRYSGSRVVSANSHRIPRAPCYTGNTRTQYPRQVSPTGLSPPPARHPRRFSYPTPLTPRPGRNENTRAPQPRTRNPCRVSHAHGFTIIRYRSPLHTEYPLLRVLRCFTSPRHPSRPTQPQTRVTPHNECQVSPFGHPRITARQPAPRGLSQATTSFIGP